MTTSTPTENLAPQDSTAAPQVNPTGIQIGHAEPITLEDYVRRADDARAQAEQELQRALAGFGTAWLLAAEMRLRLKNVIDGAQAHRPPNVKPRHPRVLVFEDALTDLAELLDQKLPTHAEAVDHWNARQQENAAATAMRMELHRYDRMLEEFEARLGVPRGVDEATPTVDRFEAMVTALLNLTTAQRAEIERLKRGPQL